jgi:hypothetical protein
MNSLDTLSLEGDLVPSDYPIDIPGGWFLMAYLHQNPADAEAMMSPLAEDLVIIKSWNGDVYWPLMNINSIGNMVSGQGYQIKTENPFTFVYEDINGRLGFDQDQFISIKFNKPLNTGNNMVIGIPSDIWLNQAQVGDEIVVYDNNGLVIGSAPYREDGTVVTVWGDDNLTKVKDGAFIGEALTVKLWRSSEYLLEDIVVESWLEGNGYYSIDGISVMGSMSQSVSMPRQLIKVTDVIGRDIKDNSEQSVLLYIYNDGTVERKYILK